MSVPDPNHTAILDLEDLAASPILNAAGRAFVMTRLADRRSGITRWAVRPDACDAVSSAPGITFGPFMR